jgi:hypothetical protein
MIVLVSSIILMFLSYHLKSSIAYLFVTIIMMKTIYMLTGQVINHTEMMMMISNRFFNMMMYTVVVSINCT